MLAAAAALALVAQTAGAAEPEAFLIDTTADLERLCAADPQASTYMAAIHMCHGYIIGVHHFHTALAGEFGDFVYCTERVDPRPTRDQAVASFLVWVSGHPEARESEALDGVLRWAATTFPCD